MSYEYLVASLPMLFPGDPPPFGMAEFLFRCSGVLTPSDLQTIDAVLAGRAGDIDHAAVQEWAAHETQLRNATALARAAVWQTDARPFLHSHAGFDGEVRDGVADAFTKASPMERERALDRCRWRILDDIARRDYFGMGAVIAFVLKLQMVERAAVWTQEAGRAALENHLRTLETGRDHSIETTEPEGRK